MDTPQEQLSQGLRRVNPEATSPHHLTSTAAHRRATANYGSGHQVTVTLATGSTLRGTHYRKSWGWQVSPRWSGFASSWGIGLERDLTRFTYLLPGPSETPKVTNLGPSWRQAPLY